jgi:histone acetyltransferase (RNA polymerase elongator complex component)
MHQYRNHINNFLEHKKEYRKPLQIAFFGGSFLGLDNHEIKLFLELATDFVNRGKVDSIRFSTRPDTIDNGRLDIIKNFPVSTVELGVQSMDDKVLKLTGRSHSAADTIRAVERLKQHRLAVGLQMMVGLPGDHEFRSLTTARKIADLRPDFVRIYPTVVVKNSRLASWYRKGNYSPLSLEEGVTLVKKIYLLFKEEKIAVVRMGLQASEDLEKESTILAGPYHSAFGHLVYSEIFLDMATAAIESTESLSKSIAIYVNPRSISKMRGLKNSNITKLKSQFQLESITVLSEASLGEDELRIDGIMCS